MKKILLLITVLFLVVSCSDISVRNNFTQYEKEQLSLLKNNIKENLLKNNIEFIEENTKDSYKNKYILNNLYNFNFSNVNIFITEPTYTDTNPSSILALNMNEDTYYFELIFIYDNQQKKWLISDFRERR